MNNFIHAIDGFNNFRVYYTDTDSIYIKRKYLELLDKSGYIGKLNGQGKNDLDYNIEVEKHLNKVEGHSNHNASTVDELKQKFIELYPNTKQSNFILMNKTLLYKTENVCLEYRAVGPKQKMSIVMDKYTGIKKEKITFKGVPVKCHSDIGLDYFDYLLE